MSLLILDVSVFPGRQGGEKPIFGKSIENLVLDLHTHAQQVVTTAQPSLDTVF